LTVIPVSGSGYVFVTRLLEDEEEADELLANNGR
jgi:hypothetical protein